MTLADDLRAAARELEAAGAILQLCGDASEIALNEELVFRLRAHADTIERVIGEIREINDLTNWPTTTEWLAALTGEPRG